MSYQNAGERTTRMRYTPARRFTLLAEKVEEKIEEKVDLAARHTSIGPKIWT